MLEVVNLALPFFGLIFLGLGCGKFKAIPETGLAWMDFFILYVALPALFYRIVAQTPLQQLANPRFIIGTMLATCCAFALSFAVGMLIRRGAMAESTIAGLAGGYGNIGYMGPGLALATLGAEATAPVALIFCFDSILPWEVPFAIAIKLVVHPLLALTLMSLLGPFAEVWVYTAVLMAALPPALNVFVFARQYNVWVEQASSSVLFGTLISVATLTTVMWLVKTHQLPVMMFR
jgi:predicted permease